MPVAFGIPFQKSHFVRERDLFLLNFPELGTDFVYFILLPAKDGLKNIIYLSGSDHFPRIRIGVGQKPNPEYDLAAWVLSRFTTEEQKALAEVFPKAAQAIEYIIQGKIDQAMNQFNEK